MTQLEGTRVLVTGGAGTIGSTLVDQLLDAGAAQVNVLDNLVRGRRANLDAALATGRVELIDGDIRDAKLVDDLTAVDHRVELVRRDGAVAEHPLLLGVRLRRSGAQVGRQTWLAARQTATAASTSSAGRAVPLLTLPRSKKSALIMLAEI